MSGQCTGMLVQEPSVRSHLSNSRDTQKQLKQIFVPVSHPDYESETDWTDPGSQKDQMGDQYVIEGQT